MPIRVLTDEHPATVTTRIQKESSVPVVPTEQGLVNMSSLISEYPTYVSENFRNTGVPAILHASSETDRWFANPFFLDVNAPDFNVISGGRAGDRYTRPVGAVSFGGSFSDRRTIIRTRGGGSFGDRRPVTPIGGGVFIERNE